MPDGSLIADTQSTREVWTGFGLADGVEGLVDAIRSDSWVDDVLAGAGLAMEVASTVMDPFGTLLASGLGWAMEYFEPLREILDQLAGQPDVVASHAATWENIAGELHDMAATLQYHLDSGLSDWRGQAADAYQALMVNNLDALDGLGAISTALAAATEAAGSLVALTRDFVRDLIADLVARVVVWAVEAIFVVTIPVVASQIAAAVLKWTSRILTIVTALIDSLTNLTKLLES